MIRMIPACRAIAMAAALVLVATTYAAAEEEAAPQTKPFSPTMYFGVGGGYAKQDSDEVGWQVSALARVIKYAGIQIEYWNVGNKPPPNGSGEQDGVYFGVMPILPIADTGLDIYGQVGAAIGDGGDDVAAGAGLMYTIPIEWMQKYNIDPALRVDYKYLNLDDGWHLLTFGIMIGLHK